MNRLVLLAAVFLGSVSHAQMVKIQVLDGKTGEPVAHEHVNLFRNGSFGDNGLNRNGYGYDTDDNGIISISDIVPDTKSFAVYIDWHKPCSKSMQWLSLAKVVSDGFVSDNTCKPKLQRSLTPGTLIFFVREETFLEKMAH